MSCSTCDPENITLCTSCAMSLFLDPVNQTCSPCRNSCLSCVNRTVCDVCFDGLIPNANGTCVLKCQLPCLKCLDNQPDMCTDCPYGSVLDQTNNKCVPTYPCNATELCHGLCGSGLNYIEIYGTTGQICAQCPLIKFCVQCDSVNNQRCTICRNGYFVNGTGVC